jgi:amino acid transporter
MKAGAFLSMIGLFSAQSVQAEVTMAFLIPRLFPRFHASRSSAWFWDNREGVAPYQMISNGVVCSMLVWLPYTILIECSTLLAIITVVIIGAAFLQLRRAQPDLERPFRMPCNMGGAVMTILPLLLLGLGLVGLDLALFSGENWDGWIVRVPVTLMTFGIGIFFHFAVLQSECINPGVAALSPFDEDVELIGNDKDADEERGGSTQSAGGTFDSIVSDVPRLLASGSDMLASESDDDTTEA